MPVRWQRPPRHQQHQRHQPLIEEYHVRASVRTELQAMVLSLCAAVTMVMVTLLIPRITVKIRYEEDPYKLLQLVPVAATWFFFSRNNMRSIIRVLGGAFQAAAMIFALYTEL